MTAIALTVAGSDSGGGAGIQADLKTFSALGCYGASVVTALTAQNTLGVQGVHSVPADFVALQLRSVLDDLPVAAAKIGMLPSPEIIAAVAAALGGVGFETVLDPVMVATSGDRLVSDDAVAAIRDRLVPQVALVTPNLPELAALVGEPDFARDEAAMERQARALLALGARAVLAKGGHGSGPESVDLLVTPDGTVRLASPRLATRNTHGTGCTLSAAVAAGLALGRPLPEAVEAAKRYLGAALAAADRLAIGRGAGPVHHFHRWW